MSNPTLVLVNELKDLVIAHDRAQEDSHFTWTREDVVYLQQLFEYFNENVVPRPNFDFNPNDPKSYEKVLKYAQGLLDDINNVSARSSPPEDVLQAFEEHLRKEAEELIKNNPSLAQKRLELLKRLGSQRAADLALVQEIRSTELILEQTLAQTFKFMPPDAARKISQRITDFKKNNPTAGVSKIAAEMERLTVNVEALSQLSTGSAPQAHQISQRYINNIETLAAYVDSFQISPSPRQALEQKMVAEFVRADISPIEALKIAQLTIQNGNCAAVIHLLSYSPVDRNDSPEIRERKKATNLPNYMRVAVSSLLDNPDLRSPAQMFVQSQANHDWLAMLKAMQEYYSSPAPVDPPPNLEKHFNETQQVPPILRMGFEKVVDLSKDKIWNVFAQSDLGIKMGQVVTQNLGFSIPGFAPIAGTAATTATMTGVGAGAAVATGAGTTAVASGAAAGGVAAAAGPVGWVAIATAAFVAIAPKFKDIISLASRKIKEWSLIAAGAVGIVAGIGTQLVLSGLGLAGGLTGGISFLVGGFAGGMTYFSLQTGSSVAGFQVLGSFASAGFTQLAGMAVVEIATPIIAIILATPIVIALLLFIINNSAYIVPPSGLPGFSNMPPEFAPKNISCPVIDGYYRAKSYDPVTETGHGSNAYWSPTTGVGGKNCRYPLPQQTGCLAPFSPQNDCAKQGLPKCPFYGFSADIFPKGNKGVYAPAIDGQPTKWRPNGTSFANAGTGYSYGFTDASGKYSILFTHLDPNTVSLKEIESGQLIGVMYNQKHSKGDNTHLHVEMQVDSKYVRPENYLCNAN